MQLALHTASPKQHWDAIHGTLGQRSATKLHWPSEKKLFPIVFAKNSEKLSSTKKLGPVKNDVAIAAKRKVNGSYICVCRK